MKIFLFSIFISISSVHAISEINYAHNFSTQVEHYFNEYFKVDDFKGENSVQISYTYHNPKDSDYAVVILPGKSESFLYYQEMFYDLKDLQASVFSMDHRGQAMSGRMLKDAEKIHVESYDHYVSDLETFLREIVRPKIGPNKKIFLIAHSMGAHIAMKLQAKRAYFSAMAMSAPMLDIFTGKYPKWVARLMTTINKLSGKSNEYAPGEEGYRPRVFTGNDVTHSKVRFSMKNKLRATNQKLRTGGVTYGWVHQTFKSNGKTVRASRKIDIPSVMFSAGLDTVVKKKAQRKACQRIIGCSILYYANAKHEIFQERDQIRDDVIQKIINLFRSTNEKL